MTEASTVDIITRLYDLADMPCLDRLLFSIMAQAEVNPMRLHVMLQRFSFAEVQLVRQATRELRRLKDQVNVTLHNWDYPMPFDLRVPLLNWGLEMAQGRYIMCLDVQQQLYPCACETLLAQLRKTPAAIALGGTILQSIWQWGDVFLPIPDQNHTPVLNTVFMIDRTRVDIKDLVFKNSKPGSEIDAFVSKLEKKYKVDKRYQLYIMAVTQQQEGPVVTEPKVRLRAGSAVV